MCVPLSLLRGPPFSRPWIRPWCTLPKSLIHVICLKYLYRPAIVVLLMSMVNEKQPFILRCAVLYCFQCFLYKNDVGQEQIISTLLPATADGMFQTVQGDMLCWFIPLHKRDDSGNFDINAHLMLVLEGTDLPEKLFPLK